MPTKVAAPGLFDGNILKRAAFDAMKKLDPRRLANNPVIFVTEVVSAVVTVFFARDRDSSHGRRALHRADRGVAVVHRAVRQFRRSGGRGPRQGAGRRAAPHPHRHACAKRLIDPTARPA